MEQLDYVKITSMTDDECLAFFGVGRDRLLMMLELLEATHRRDHPRSGRPMTLDICGRLTALLRYYKTNCTMEGLAIDYGVSASTICKAIHWTERVLLRILEPGKNISREKTTSELLSSYL